MVVLPQAHEPSISLSVTPTLLGDKNLSASLIIIWDCYWACGSHRLNHHDAQHAFITTRLFLFNSSSMKPLPKPLLSANSMPSEHVSSTNLHVWALPLPDKAPSQTRAISPRPHFLSLSVLPNLAPPIVKRKTLAILPRLALKVLISSNSPVSASKKPR